MTNRVCARMTIYLLVAVAVLTLTPPVSFAGSNPTVLPPPVVYNKTYAEWSVLWWQYFLPLTQTQYNNCTIGQAPHNVAFLFGKATGQSSVCPGTVSSLTSLFFPIGNVDCSSFERSPFFGATAPDRDNCAFNFFFSSSFPLSTGTVVFDG
jgi:hypothetical protein